MKLKAPERADHFDALCRATEVLWRRRNRGEDDFARGRLLRVMKRAVLISCPPLTYPSPEESADIAATYCQPFGTVAIDDGDSAVVLEKSRASEWVQVPRPRGVSPMDAADAIPVSADAPDNAPGLHSDSVVTWIEANRHQDGQIYVALGIAWSFVASYQGRSLGFATLPVRQWELRSGRVVSEVGPRDLDRVGLLTLVGQERVTNIGCAMQEVHTMMRPNYWIVRQLDETAGPVVARGHIPRSYERRRHVVITNKELVRMRREPNPENAGKVVRHPRRGHWRVLRSERYGENRWKAIYVKPHWVGSREVRIDGVRYDVLVDV